MIRLIFLRSKSSLQWTKSEMTKRTFYSTDVDQPHFLADPARRHLDTHFRLLRHDIFGELKQIVGALMTAVDIDPSLLSK